MQHGAGRLLRRRLGDLRNGCLESGRRAAEMHGAQPGCGLSRKSGSDWLGPWARVFFLNICIEAIYYV